MVIYRIEDMYGFGFETSNYKKRQLYFDSDVRFGFIDDEYKVGDLKLSIIDHIQLYIGITQYLSVLPLFELSQKIITVENNCLKKFHSLSESDFLVELKKCGFDLYLYEIDDRFTMSHDKFNSNEVVFLYRLHSKKTKYKPNVDSNGVTLHFNKEWDVAKNRHLTEDMFV